MADGALLCLGGRVRREPEHVRPIVPHLSKFKSDVLSC
jgi:hypothetical protein